MTHPIRNMPRATAQEAMDCLYDGWYAYKDAWGMWTAIFLLYLGIQLIISLIPIINIFHSIVNVLLMGGWAYVAHHYHQTSHLDIRDFFEPLPTKWGPLAVIGAITLVGTLVIVGSMFALIFGVQALGMVPSGNVDGSFFLLVLGLMAWMLLLISPLIMATWFAPYLIVLQNMGIKESLEHSFWACWHHWWALSVLGLVLFLLGFAVMLGTLFLGMLVFMPVFFLTNYAVYRRLFEPQQEKNAKSA